MPGRERRRFDRGACRGDRHHSDLSKDPNTLISPSQATTWENPSPPPARTAPRRAPALAPPRPGRVQRLAAGWPVGRLAGWPVGCAALLRQRPGSAHELPLPCRDGERRASSSLSIPPRPLVQWVVARKTTSVRAPLCALRGSSVLTRPRCRPSSGAPCPLSAPIRAPRLGRHSVHFSAYGVSDLGKAKPRLQRGPLL